jgi:hypothetical protein
VVSPGNTQLVFSSDGGVYTYDWTTEVVGKAENNRGMNVQLVMGNNNSMNQSHANRNLIGAGMWDTGSMLVNTAANVSTRISYLFGADGGAFGMSGDNANHMVGSFGAPWTRHRSVDQGQTWTQLDAGCSLTVEAPMAWPFALTLEPTPNFGHRAYTFGITGSGSGQSYKIFRQSLTSPGCGWTDLHATNLPTLFSQTNLGDMFLQVANNPAADVVYLGAERSDRIWTLTGDAPLMALIERTPSFTPSASPGQQKSTYLSADRNPGRPNTAYQVFWDKLDNGRLYLALTDNAGVTWENVRQHQCSRARRAGVRVDWQFNRQQSTLRRDRDRRVPLRRSRPDLDTLQPGTAGLDLCGEPRVRSDAQSAATADGQLRPRLLFARGHTAHVGRRRLQERI